jgi:hypothetical protein
MEHIKIEILGKFTKYAKLTAEQGYCFYDVEDEEKYYTTSTATPITDIEELKRKYVIIYGDADKLNEQLQQEKEAKDV